MQYFLCNGKGRGFAPGRPATFAVALTVCLLLATQRQAGALTLLSIRDISQSAGASYFVSHAKGSGQPGERDTSSSEDYNFGFEYSILAPQLIKGKTSLYLEYQQDSRNGADSSDVQLRYNINSMLFSKDSFPVSISANSSRQTISETFGPTYSTDTDSLVSQLSLLNNFVPSSIQYSRQSTQTSGLVRNFRQSSDSFVVNATPNLGMLGSLNLGVSMTESDSAAVESSLATHNATSLAQASYNKTWMSPTGFSRGFGASYVYQQATGVVRMDNQSLSSNMDWQFGKALQGRATWMETKSMSDVQESRTRTATGSLTHRLMGSLATSVNLYGNEQQFDNGASRSLSGGLAFNYNKRLPQDSNFNAGYNYGKGYQESTGAVSEVQVTAEQHTTPLILPRRIKLNNETFIADSIEVVGGQTMLPYPPGSYTVIADGIELIADFAGDSTVLISYRYRRDPSTASIATSHSASTSVGLFGDKYRLYANARSTGQEVIRGQATAVTLVGTSHYDAGANANLGRHKLGGEMGYDKTYAQNHYYIYSSWSYSAPYLRGNLSLDASDRMTWGTQQGGAEPWLNSLGCQASYYRNFNNIAARLKASYSNSLVETGDMAQYIGLLLNLEGKFGKLTAMLTSSMNWSYSSLGTSLSESIGFSLRRAF
ncbi:hypothetical protein KP004_14505 [Geomonas oryzisoli]|uniref:TIGR03016 family PEP-CTERM system-associated outer membrane protein n=1 Tax=Geomonas oryzisoli TaxID=2847992 RepID=A0ABX8J6S2_9BACT|nr:hypothetical protein [Geomonas oryzisoli]QWV92409.1 hypothetical protein KP004_14505 [Geomonas oryzisoli]